MVRKCPSGTAALLCLAVALIGLGMAQDKLPVSPGGNAAAPAPPAGRSAATLTRYAMKIAANGQHCSIYPKDPLHPFDSTDWYAEIPIAITAHRYDPSRQELLIAVDYAWQKSDEDAVRTQLAAKYKEANRPVAPEAITIFPLDVEAHQLILSDLDRQYVVFSTNHPQKLTAQTLAFRVPMMAGADRLHERLSTTPEAVQLVLKAGYRFDRVAGLTIDRRAISAAWQRVLEQVLPNQATRAESLLVDRDAEQTLQARLAAELAVVVRSFGLTPAEEAKALKLALAQIDKLALPTAPMTVRELLDLGEANQVFTAAVGKIEARPATNDEAITKLKEERASWEKVVRVAEIISDLAGNSAHDDRAFHSKARHEIQDRGGSAGASFLGIFSLGGSAGLHLDVSESDLTERHLKDIREARAFAQNKALYCRDVQERYSKEVEGRLRKSESTAPLLRLRRVSAAALIAHGSAGATVERITGSEVLFISTPVALKATPKAVENDVVLALHKQVATLQARIDQLEKATSTDVGKVRGEFTAGLKAAAERAAKAEEKAEQQRIRFVSGGDAKAGHLRIGDVLMCWGQETKGNKPESHVRSFDFQFPVEFAAPPNVSIRTDGGCAPRPAAPPGFTFTPYRSTVTSTTFACDVVDGVAELNWQLSKTPFFKKNIPLGTTNDVTLSYLAIGRAKD